MGVRPVTVEVSLPFGIGKVTLKADEAQQRAAWALYVELITRVSVQPLDDEHGLLREALNSLYSIFQVTRTVLKEAGPSVARGPQSLGPIAIAVLNMGLRPFLSEWHPRLLAYEQMMPRNMTQFEYERQWEHFDEMRESLRSVQSSLLIYADLLARISRAKIGVK